MVRGVGEGGPGKDMYARLTIIALACVPGVLFGTGAVAVAAGPPVRCPSWSGPCDLRPSKPGKPGARTPAPDRADRGGGKSSRCFNETTRKPTPCSDPFFGVWNAATDCYEKTASPQPPKSDPAWQGHTTGVIVETTCPGVPGTEGGWVWRPRAPDAGVSVTPAVLARRALEQLPISGPSIRMAPRRGATGLVGLPVWMWTRRSASTWGPSSETASVPGLSVTATARGERIVWSMGDGRSVTCRGPGTAYQERFGNRVSPTCGYRYSRSSAHERDGVYRVTATTTWRVDWSGGGDSGTIRVTRSSSTTVRVGEMQVLIQQGDS